MTETEKLILEVETKGAGTANKELDKLDRNAKKTEGSFGKLKGAVTAFGAAAAAAAVFAGKKLYESTKSYQDLNAQLKVATGSAENAATAYAALTKFAATTPYSVEQATNSFIKLVNLGLTPSEKALRSYGNTASSMGKELTDFIEAVADASTGEFERLKEFGIKASKQGEQVAFTFQGTTKVVKGTASEIENFLIGIGENQFAGAMAERMKTLSGAVSNLGDSWDQLWITLSKLGPDNLIVQGVQAITGAIDELHKQIKSGQLEGYINAQREQWRALTDDVDVAVEAIKLGTENALEDWGKLFDLSEDDMDDWAKHFPIQARAAVEGVGVWFWQMVDELKLVAKGTVANFQTEWDRLVEIAKATGKKVGEVMSFGLYNSGDDYQATIKLINDQADAKKKADLDAFHNQKDLNNKAAEEALANIDKERVARIAANEQLKKNADNKRTDYDLDNLDVLDANKDNLAGFKVGGKGTPGANTGGKSGADAAKEAQKRLEEQIRYLEQGLTTENKVIADNYEVRKQQILDAEGKTNAEKQNLILTALSQSLMTEQEAINAAYETRKNFILSNTELTEQSKTDLMKRLTEAREKEITKIEKTNMEARLDAASTFFGNIASIGSTFGKKGFKIAQAAAIAQATIKTYESATSAYASLAGIPYVGPALGAAAAAAAIAAGVANIAQIKSQTYSGAYEHGGMIPGGKYGLVGEAGPEFVRGPAVVTSAATTRASGGNASGPVRVTVNNLGQPAQVSSRMNGEELEIVLRPILDARDKRMKDGIANDISKGGGGVSKAMENTYGLNRGRGTT